MNNLRVSLAFMAATPPNAAVLISVALQRGIPATALAKSIGWLPTFPLTRPIWKALDLGGRRPHQSARQSIYSKVSRETDNKSGVHGAKSYYFLPFLGPRPAAGGVMGSVWA